MKNILNVAVNGFVVSMLTVNSVMARHPNVDDNGVDQGGGSHADSGCTDGICTLKNPLGDITSIQLFISKIIEIIILLAQPVLVLAFLWIGFSFVMAQGNATKLQDVRRNLGYTLLGAFVIIGAKVISLALSGTIASLLK